MGLVVILAVHACTGCGARKRAAAERGIELLAVMPIEVMPPERGEASVQAARDEWLPESAGCVVTAQIYGVLAERPEFRFVPDLTIAALSSSESVRRAGSRSERALALGREARADAVLFGSVSRFRERVGTELGARTPAAVAFELALADVHTGEILWQGRFEETQQPLSSNLLQLWMFWRAGPRWLSAAELARLGVERLLKDMRKTLGY